ncbi:hypothetical protein PUNSTDRAFT_134825 [Punctularia strigosozonata HHB-11173 SS5]|uniref:uncharacterized protein n=1 Tax=Punctularia strigosozonata (strain HHB-11173) TaxID=741275 RepID=UPI0004416A13|nr:uncharacterized protein PUNSTDRAFT_134825 [Punctularia strigosozonata HHB-11173 SS5]EIN08444.1 hypothetical protein PUNSTDRAFT_134825 [Punctularia strigosozonata HHB-11173 SS5]
MFTTRCTVVAILAIINFTLLAVGAPSPANPDASTVPSSPPFAGITKNDNSDNSMGTSVALWVTVIVALFVIIGIVFLCSTRSSLSWLWSRKSGKSPSEVPPPRLGPVTNSAGVPELGYQLGQPTIAERVNQPLTPPPAYIRTPPVPPVQVRDISSNDGEAAGIKSLKPLHQQSSTSSM